MKEIYYERPKFGGIYQRKDGRFCCEVIIGFDAYTGKQIKKYLYGNKKIDVKSAKEDFLLNWDSKNYEHGENALITEVEKWFYILKINDVKGSSFDRMEQTYKYQVLPALEDIGIKKISDFDACAAGLVLNYVRGQNYSASTLKKTKGFLSDFFNYAVKCNMAKYNPFSVITLKENPIIDENDEENSKIVVFEEDEIERFKKACAARYKNGVPRFHQGKYFIFMLNTGIRLGEALATKYSDIDFETGVYTINKTVTTVKERDKNGKKTGKQKRFIQTPKTKNSKRTMRLNQDILDIVKELKAAEPEGYDGLIIHSKNGGILGARSFEKRFYRILKYADIKQCGIHTLRHTFASMAYVHSKGQIEVVSKLLGHCDPTFTAKIYVTIFEKYKDAVMNDFVI